MKPECDMIRDILPLYVEDLASPYTRTFVEEHLTDCPECQRELDIQKSTAAFPVPEEAELLPLKSMQKTLQKKRLKHILLTAALVLLFLVILFSQLMRPVFLPYSEDLITVTENAGGSITVTYPKGTTSTNIMSTTDTYTGSSTVFLEAYYTPFSRIFGLSGPAQETITPSHGEDIFVYYSQNGSGLLNAENDILLYASSGKYRSEAVISLPRLSLGYYALLAALLAIILGIALAVCHKWAKARLVLTRLLLLPISYLLGHLVVKGFSTVSWSLPHDILFIALAGLVIYAILLLIHSLILARRKKQSS